MIHLRRLRWGPLNVAHIARHQVTLEEVEQVCHAGPVELRSYLDRLVLIGPTQAGKVPVVVLEPEVEDVYYPVTARPACRKERRYYQQQRGDQGR